MSDDLDMHALATPPANPAAPNAPPAPLWPLSARAEAAFDAGCDLVLQCSGKLEDMVETVRGCPPLGGRALERALAVEAIARRAQVWDQPKALARIAALVSKPAAALV